jgi:hypothetical protein
MKKHLIYLAASCFYMASSSAAIAQTKVVDPEIQPLVNFLVSDQLLTESKAPGTKVPLSFYLGTKEDISRYFGDLICTKVKACEVKDEIYTIPNYAILGTGLKGSKLQGNALAAQLQIERTDMAYGVNIYDAASWQIALALAARNGNLDRAKAKKLIDGQLSNISYKEPAKGNTKEIDQGNRAATKTFKYGYQTVITDADKAFTFRMISKNFFNKDPFVGGRYEKGLSMAYDPNEAAANDKNGNSADTFTHVSTWSDYKPIIGENAWAQLIGPLQAEYILTDGKVAATSPELKNAMNLLDAFSAMQAGIGAFYYAPGGSLGNTGGIPPGEISLENNFSMLGGLQILNEILKTTEQTEQVKAALGKVHTMLYGGKTVNGYNTIGLLSFMRNGAFDTDRNIFYTHGTATDSASQTDWKPNKKNESGALAVDVNTWGMSALGVNTIAKWFGEDVPRKIWQNVRKGGGYFGDGNDDIWGVGYTLKNTEPDQMIMSTEWTAGAISALESLKAYYGGKGADVAQFDKDLGTMKSNIVKLRNDKYLDTRFNDATSDKYFIKVPESTGQAYLYASKRWLIPFGWYANAISSTTSNAWVIMNKIGFNPFQYKGALLPETPYDEPAKRDISGGGGDSGGVNGPLPAAVEVKIDSGTLLTGFTAISLASSAKNPPVNWKYGLAENKQCQGRSPSNKCEASGKAPAGALVLSISYNKGGWQGACRVYPAGKICTDAACTTTKIISADASSNDGTGDCNLK